MNKRTHSEAIRVANLNYNIHSKSILEEISLSVPIHSFVGLIGPNGSGKTTLIRHIYRALPPPTKTVYVNGREIESISFREAAKSVTVMRQENNSEFSYSILEMVLMGRSPHKRLFEGDTGRDMEIAQNALDRVGMKQMASRRYASLSGGEKQRVLIARSLAQEADILLLDEPTNHLDVHYQWSLMETIKGLGKTVLAVFHELNLACAFCDYLYVLKDHKIVAKGPPAAVCTREMLADVFCVNSEIMYSSEGVPQILFSGVKNTQQGKK